jgi:hypothetical protein
MACSCPAIRGIAGLTPLAASAIVARFAWRWEGQMRHKRWMRWSVRAACPIATLIALAMPRADEAGGTVPGSFRAAQEVGLDFSLRPVDLLNVAPGSPPPGSFRAAQDIGAGDAWSRRYGDRWSAEGYQGPGVPPPWAGGRDQPLDSRGRF